MPTYVYECSSCKNTFEVEQRITEDPLKDCECGSKGTLKRLIQPAGIMLKGSGFHINDYAPSKPAEESSSKTESPKTDTPAAPAAPAAEAPAPAASAPAAPSEA
jgi:putative FmdB family regulatory protein